MSWLKRLRKWILDQSLTKKLLISYLLILLVPMLLYGTYALHSSRDYVAGNMDTAFSGMAERAERLIEVKRVQLENMLRLCADNETLQEAYENEYTDRYEQHVGIAQQIYTFYSNMMSYYYGDIDGLCFYSCQDHGKYNRYFAGMRTLETQSWYEQALQYQRTGDIHWCIDGEDIFAVIWIYKGNRVSPRYEPLGVLYCSLDMKFFIDRYAGLNWDSYRMEILDDQGEVLLTFDKGEMGTGDSHAEYSFPSELGWTFRYYVSYDMERQMLDLLNVHLLTSVLAMLIMIVVIVLLTHTLLKRLYRLKHQMEAVQAGNMTIEVSSAAQDEIGQLTNSFGDMLARLRAMMDERVKAERQIGELELRVLRAQIDPHFLDNTLSYINWHALRSGDREISEIVIQLASFYRTCLNEGYEMITVEREMDNARAYVEIQAMLHDYSFDAVFHVQPEAAELKMLCFLLQPLVENAIRHGVDCKKDGRGTVEISACVEGDRLILQVSDDGPGMDVAAVCAPKKNGSGGYGISNIISRINLIYGEEYGLTFEQNLPSGLRVKVVLPVKVK